MIYKMSFSVTEIAKTLRDSKRQGTPIVVFTGAGCSKSSGMPLASELISEINKKYKGNLKSLPDQQKKDYGACMSRLTPHEQKTLIEKHISKAKINWAHIALASLLKHGYLGKVLTFNFDNILTRACSLDNFFPPTYDLKVLSEEYFSAIPNQSIVHLHGQWSGFQLANSDKDTGTQAEKLKNYIKNTINTSPSLFIGYSGGADAFFKLVEEDFIGQHRLFWVDYAKEPNSNVRKFIDANPNHRNYIPEQDADQFLLELAIELKCFPTDLFKDSIQYMKSLCEEITAFPLIDSKNHIDILSDIKTTLEAANTSKTIITSIKLASYFYSNKYDAILNQVKNLDLSSQHIAKIVAATYLRKSLEFISKDEKQFSFYFNKALEIQPKFPQAFLEVANKFYDIFIKKNQKQALKLSLDNFTRCLEHDTYSKNELVLGKYALAKFHYGKICKSIDIINESLQIFQKVLKANPSELINIGNYANALAYLANLKENEEIFNQAFFQYELALQINPYNANSLRNYGNATLGYARIKDDDALFQKSLELLEKAISIERDRTYNLAGYYALRKNYEVAKLNLLHAEKHKTLPRDTYNHLKYVILDSVVDSRSL